MCAAEASKVERCVREAVGVLAPGRDPRDVRLLLGLSGGADSVALLLALRAARVDVRAVHCNFSLRGGESDRDERFVRELCLRLSVPLEVRRFDTRRYCSQRRLSLEEGCRSLRYDLFREEMARQGCVRVAVAHHADDNAETFLLELMRGAGLRGLKAMLPDNGEVVRPLLGCTRADITAYLESAGETFVVDSTNADIDFSRNFVRNEVMPLLATRWPSAAASIARSAECLREDFMLLLPLIQSTGAKDRLDYSELESSGAPRSLLYYFISTVGGTRHTAGEMLDVWRRGRVGAVWHLDGTDIVSGRRGFEKVAHACFRLPELEIETFAADADILRQVREPDGNRTLWLGEDPSDFRLRPRRTGDRISPLGMKGSSLVSDIVKDAHLDAAESRGAVVLEHIPTGEIVWVPGLKRSRRHLIDLKSPPATVCRLRLSVKE